MFVFFFQIGSLSWSVLPGKVMFRDVAYITTDYTVRVQDGFLIFRWWRSYVPKDASGDLSHADTRVSVQLNGFEYHAYNRTQIYRELEKKIYGDSNIREAWSKGEANGIEEGEEPEKDSPYDWRDLIPVIKIDISSGKVVFGNRTLPTTLVISAEEARCTYSTKAAGCPIDKFMHFLKCKAENFKILLAPSPKYTGLRDEPPRFMGESGFVVVSSNDVYLYYYADEPGVRKEIEDQEGVPEWGVDIKCGKGTKICHGPWVDRQREIIYKFFFPPDYQNIEPTVPSKVRQPSHFRIRLSTQTESTTLDVLFSKNKETKAVYLALDKGTNFEVKVPWITGKNGYKTTISGTLMMVEATTSLSYREILCCETLEVNIDCFYPPEWNGYQKWIFKFTGSKASLHFIFGHKWFFQEMIDDWSAKSYPDLFYFVPYEWKFQFILKKFEILTLANEFNWIDTTSLNLESAENALLAICGENLKISFSLPYKEFLPRAIPYLFNIKGQKVDLSLFLPETNTSRDIFRSLDCNAKVISRNGKWTWKKAGNTYKWRNLCAHEKGWVDCWSAPSVNLLIEFFYHPVPPPGPIPQAEVSTPEKEKLLLDPLRAPFKTSPINASQSLTPENFEPDSLPSDKCRIVLDVDGSTAYLCGTLIRNFMHVKENLFGEDQSFTPMDGGINGAELRFKTEVPNEFDPRLFRPIDVVLEVSVTNLMAHLLKHCSESEAPCPALLTDELVFEMDKNYRETRLQLQMSPTILKSGDPVAEERKQLILTGLQFRGHAMFSEFDRPVGCDTLEYAWLIEIQCGVLTGKINPVQLFDILIGAEMFMFLAVDRENVLKHPRSYKLCQHNENQKSCSAVGNKGDGVDGAEACSTVEELKYRLVRLSMDAVDLSIVTQKDSLLKIQACPLRFSTCNLHGLHTKQGITATINDIRIQQYISSNFPLVQRPDMEPEKHHPDLWIESGSLKFGPVYIEGSLSGPCSLDLQRKQHNFLQKHDAKTNRLWFLWPKSGSKNCGCLGGCNFFGANANGLSFFNPNRRDIQNRHNVAVHSLGHRKKNPGYGQSILRDQKSNVVKNVSASESFLPAKWPNACHEPAKLPRISTSDTNPRLHRGFSTKCRVRSTSNTSEKSSEKLESSKSSPEKVQSFEDSKYTLARADSLMSDVLSFYSFSGSKKSLDKLDDDSTTVKDQDVEDEDEDNDDGVSTTNNSYISAMEEAEDYSLVNLHMQVDKAITESPLLMSSYLSHLTQLRLVENSDLHPSFDVVEDGFSSIKMVDREGDKKAYTSESDKLREMSAAAGDSGMKYDENRLLSDDNTSKTTIVVKFKGSVDIVLCPIFLESAERLLEALRPVFQMPAPSVHC